MEKKFFILLFVILSAIQYSFAQNLGSWTSVQFTKQLSEKLSVASKPILIHNQDFKNHAATFLDNSLKYKFGKEWHALFLTRNFFVDEGPYRHFFFFDIGHTSTLSTDFKMVNAVRYHLAPDFNVQDSDFLRYHFKLVYSKLQKLKPYVGNQFFFRLNGVNKVERLRTIIGLNIPVANSMNLGVALWREGYDIMDVEDAYFLITNLQIKL